MGVISRAEMAPANEELEIRRHVLDLVKDRLRLAANEEQNAERALESETSHKAMVKFEGNGTFSKSDLAAISSEFEFHFPFPVARNGARTNRSAQLTRSRSPRQSRCRRKSRRV